MRKVWNFVDGLNLLSRCSQRCHDVSFFACFRARLCGKVAPDATEVIPYKGSKTQTLDIYGTINDACQIVTMFHDIGQRVGPDLNNANWVNTINTYGPITNRGSGPYSSLTKGKYDAEDDWRLEQIDTSLPPDGQFRSITPLQVITG